MQHRTPLPDMGKLADAIGPVINGSAREVIDGKPAETGSSPPLGLGATAAVLRATDDSCDIIQKTIDQLTDLQAKLHAEAGELANHIGSYTKMAAAISSAFVDFQREGERQLRDDE
jgi:hypothetical protein